jgi:hypothetical protein
MRQWAVFLCSGMAGSFTLAGVLGAEQGKWWHFAVDLLLAAGFAVVAWYHLEQLEVKP